jgi:hypothetical protein
MVLQQITLGAAMIALPLYLQVTLEPSTAAEELLGG